MRGCDGNGDSDGNGNDHDDDDNDDNANSDDDDSDDDKDDGSGNGDGGGVGDGDCGATVNNQFNYRYGYVELDTTKMFCGEDYEEAATTGKPCPEEDCPEGQTCWADVERLPRPDQRLSFHGMPNCRRVEG